MKSYKILIHLVLMVMVSASGVAASEEAPPADPGWPRVFEKNGKQLTVYQPQVDYWNDYKDLRCRFAIAVKTGPSQQEKLGVVEIDADTVVDHAERVVDMVPKKREMRFPNTSEAEATSLEKVVDELHPPSRTLTVSLDRVLAYLDPDQQPQQQAVELNLDPPKIFYSQKPAILVMFLGEPELKPVEKDKTELMFAVNTNWDVFYDATGQRYYLLNGDNWLATADAVKGSWRPAEALPAGLSSLPQDDNWADVRQQVPGKRDQNPPVVFVSTEPAELLVTAGEPSFSPIPGTKLMRVANTDIPVFLFSGDKTYYLLIAGRWFRAAGLDGPWTVASLDLPGDFARIPDSDPAAFVKASVPGTVEARDAVLLASVPATTAVDVSKPAAVEVGYSGEPKFEQIPSTTVQYAANSPQSVFFVDGGYYCCDQGVWFCGSAATGPWTYCKSVPQAIYTIPASHPTHNVTYVVVQNTTPTTVVYSQTAGYSGEYVAANGVLMFGAGMIMGAIIADHHDDHYGYYPPYPVPYSYGCGARYSYAYGGYYRGAAVYGPYGGAGAAARYNPYSGTYSRGAYAYGPAGSASVRQAYNPYTGARARAGSINTAYGSAGRGVAYNPSTGTAVRGGYRSNAYGTVGGVQTNRGTGAVGWNTQNSQGAVVKGKNNVYAGKDGTVYKKDGSGNWSSNTGNGWQSVNKPQQPRSASAASTSASTGSRAQSSTSGGKSATTAQTRQPSSSSMAQTRQPSTASRSSVSRESARSLESQAQARQRGNQMSQRVSKERSSGSSFGGRGSGGGSSSFGGRGGGGGGRRGR
ncbi:MAG: hypothetical protein RBT11_15465 [Desulfobacterales bacterium]|jgi:hypothetical protein|nr:hypothetical protein [Desulfobacterales bacterium]